MNRGDMKAMILAAGLGTRLKPLTDRIPKALVEINGIPMLDRVINTLKNQGFTRLVVNVHHLSGQIVDHLSRKDYGVKIMISDESSKLLDTGGGILKASEYLFEDDDQPVLIHNVDILSNADLKKLMQVSIENNEGTLLVSDRDSSRKLIFDRERLLKGWHDLKMDKFRPEEFQVKPEYSEKAFSGIYTITKREVDEMRELMEETNFPIMDYFLSKERKEKIRGLEQKDLRLIDIGKPATMLQASDLLKDTDINSN